MGVDYPTAVRTLVDWHREGEQPPQRIFIFSDPDGQEVRLLEVTVLVPETGELYPIAFGATSELPYRTVVVQVTPDEWEAIEAGEIPLPEGWDMSSCEEL